MRIFFYDYFSKLTEKQLVLLWLLFCFIALTYKLGGVPPYHSDENFYVESSRNMVETGDYLTPVFNDKKRFAKPILYYWLVSASYKIFGVNLSSARLTSALFGSLTIGLLYLLSTRLFDRRIAFYSILILPATFLHFQISRWATTDIVMSFFILVALYYFVRGYQNDFKEKLNSYLFYLAMALGFMVKGPPAIIIPVLIAIVFLVTTKRKGIGSKLQIGQGLMILMVIIIPWFATMLSLHGDEFRNHIVGAEIEGRLAHNSPFSLYYFGVVIRYHLPWSLFFVAAVCQQFGVFGFGASPLQGGGVQFKQIATNMKAQFKSLFVKENEPVLFCYIWILVCLALFTLVRTEHSRYMLPASPALAILTAKFFADLEKMKGIQVGLGYKIPATLTGIILLTLALLSGVALVALALMFNVPFWFFVLPIMFLFGGLCVIQCTKTQQYGKQIFAIAFVLVFGFSLLSGDVLPHASCNPMKIMSEAILAEKFRGPIGVYRLGNSRAKLGVLTGQKVTILYLPEYVERFLETDEEVRIVMRAEDLETHFADVPFKILAEESAWLEGRIDWRRMKELLGKAEAGGTSNLSEKIYLLSNK